MKLTAAVFVFLGMILLIGATYESGSEIRFVDVSEVMNNYEKAKKNQEDLQKGFAPQVAEMQRRSDDYYKKQKELSPLDQNSKEYYQKAVELEVEQVKLKRDGEFLRRDMDKKRAQNIVTSYDEIRDAIKKYAEANQLKAVLYIQKDSNHGDEDLKDKFDLLRQRQVLFADPSLDVTQQIIKILNSH